MTTTDRMDISDTIIAKSDQLNADDLISGPVTATISGVSRGAADQPVNLHLTEFPGKAYRPGKSMRRVLVAAWGKYAADYVGRSLTLYRDPTTTWAGEEVGGIRISHMSHIEKTKRIVIQERRGKKTPYVVEPLAVATPVLSVSDAEIESADVDGLRALWSQASPVQQSRIRERVTELQAEDGDV